MCEVAAHLTDHVLPHVPARQWVLSVPKRLRPYLHHDVRVAGAVLQILLRTIRATLRRSSPTASSRAQLGAVSFFHRFGSSLNVHPHYHLVVLDGVFSKADDSEIAFHEAYDLTPDRIAQVESVVQKRVLRDFRRQGLLDEVDAAGMLNWQGSGGFSIDASVRIEAEDRAGIERLVRYCARPPFALDPIPDLRALEVPAIFFYGELDLTAPPDVSVPVLDAILEGVGASADLTVRILEDVPHNLERRAFYEEGSGAWPDSFYVFPRKAPRYEPLLAAWLASHGVTPRPSRE
jgi:hypothetical protein